MVQSLFSQVEYGSLRDIFDLVVTVSGERLAFSDDNVWFSVPSVGVIPRFVFNFVEFKTSPSFDLIKRISDNRFLMTFQARPEINILMAVSKIYLTVIIRFESTRTRNLKPSKIYRLDILT